MLKSKLNQHADVQCISFIFPIAFAMTMASVGMIGNIAFYLDIQIKNSIYIFYFIPPLYTPR